MERALPSASFDSIRLALAYYFESKRMITFVQIGACDGVSGDSVHDFIMQGWMRAVLVEPIEPCFRKLKQVYENVPNVTTIRAAIGKHDGRVILFKVKEGAKSIDPYWSSQLASFNKSHLVKHGVPAEEIEEVEVPCLTLRSLLAQCGLERAVLLQTDTEGFDDEIVTMALELPVLPECIIFEHIHLNARKINDTFAKLQEHGYVWLHDEWNTLALRGTLVDRWRPRRLH
jgi:FkbM family methyltransferase